MPRASNESKRKPTLASSERSPASLGAAHERARAADLTRDQAIRWRAFELFEQRIRQELPGDPDSDWLRAEREVDARLAADRVQSARGAAEERDQ